MSKPRHELKFFINLSDYYALKNRIKHIGLMSIFWTQKVKLFYAALLANNSH